MLDSNREFFYLWSQKEWLEKELQTSDARWKIVVLHHPLYSVKGKYNNLAQKTIFNSLIQKYNVDLVLQGHEHAYARMTLHDEQGSATPPVYTVSHCSPKSYRIT
ncbi:metallophosphoesterase family protein, partial [Escherichia coli]|uniref:metallophosphoesterase family protein n=1 Tax=Escherichia coli TaxID=562 RepID=UPI001C4957F4